MAPKIQEEKWKRYEAVDFDALGIPREYSPAALAEAETVREELPRIVQVRTDLSALPALAIDDPETVEVDDALAVEETAGGWTVHVLICDVAAAIPRDRALDAEAAARAVTLYHPVRRVPMFPPELTRESLSLTTSALRPVLDLRLSFDGHRVPYDFTVVPCAARIHRRMSYEDADAVLAGAGPRDSGALHVLHELAEALFRQRVERGARPLFQVEVKVRVAEGIPVLRSQDTSSPARRLVSEFMVAAGAGAGALLHGVKAPAIYRNQEPPDEPMPWTMEKARDPVFVFGALRRLKRASVTLVPGAHAGLGVSSYCQVTSPLRRYADLLLQRQLHSVVTRGVPEYGDGELLHAMAKADLLAGEVHTLEREADLYWRTTALAGARGDKVSALLINTDRKQYQVWLPAFALMARYFPRRERQPGERIDLVVVQADAKTGTIVLRED